MEGQDKSISIPMGLTLDEAERRYVLATYEQMGRDKMKTAQVLGVGLTTLYRRLHEWGQNSSTNSYKGTSK